MVYKNQTHHLIISGSTCLFASNLSQGDVSDFIILLGNVLDLEFQVMPQLQMLKQILYLLSADS